MVDGLVSRYMTWFLQNYPESLAVCLAVWEVQPPGICQSHESYKSKLFANQNCILVHATKVQAVSSVATEIFKFSVDGNYFSVLPSLCYSIPSSGSEYQIFSIHAQTDRRLVCRFTPSPVSQGKCHAQASSLCPDIPYSCSDSSFQPGQF